MKIDACDGEPWTEIEVRHLRVCLNSGDTIEQAAAFLYRSGTVEDVRRKAEERGLSYKTQTTNNRRLSTGQPARPHRRDA
jgi:hypothetical protein